MMPRIIAVLLGPFLLDLCSSKTAGPYYIDVREFGNCLTEEVGEFGDDISFQATLHHQRGSNYRFYSGNLTLKNGLLEQPGSSVLTSYVSKWNPVSGWRKNFAVLRIGETCQALRLYGGHMKDRIQKFFPGVEFRCPIRDGTYTLRNITSHHEAFPFFPSVWYGLFRCHTLWTSLRSPSAKPRACLRWVAEFVEKVANGSRSASPK